jgi:hypothetical protein
VKADLICFVTFFLSAIFFDKLPMIESMRRISVIGKKSLFTISVRSGSDLRKEKLLRHYSSLMFLESLRISIYIAMVLAATVGIYSILSLVFMKGGIEFEYLVTLRGIVVTLIAFSSFFLIKYLYGRKRI